MEPLKTLKKVNKTDRPLGNPIFKEERTNYQFQEWKGDINTDPTGIMKQMREHYEQL